LIVSAIALVFYRMVGSLQPANVLIAHELWAAIKARVTLSPHTHLTSDAIDYLL